MVKIAYCIVAHKYTPVLSKCIEWLSAKNVDFYLHVDLKSDLSSFNGLRDKVTILENRIDVQWAAFSQIECTLNLFQETVKKEYDFIILISGDTLPLFNNEYIHLFFEQNLGNQFVYTRNFIDESFRDRVKYKYPSKNLRVTKDSIWYVRLINKIRRRFKIYRKNSLYKKLIPLFMGPNWIVITPEFRDYIYSFLEHNSYYREGFKNSLCGDELFFHTILNNSRFAATNNNHLLWYTDWETGPDQPRVLDETDFKRMKQIRDEKNLLFARKINDHIDLELYEKYFLA